MKERDPKSLLPNGVQEHKVRGWLHNREPRVQSLGLQYSASAPVARRSVSSMSASVCLHVALISLLIRVPYLVRLAGSKLNPVVDHAGQNVYVLRRLSISEYFPVMRPPGPGGKPDQGTRKQVQPARGSRAVDPRGVIVSAPRNPDNFRQTIVQPASPPDLKIPTDIKLPNIISGNFPPPPQKEWKPEVTVPSQTVMKSLAASLTSSRQVVNAPRLALDMPRIQQPHLEVPLPSAPAVPQSSQGDENGTGVQPDESVRTAVNLADLGIQGTAGGSKALLSLSVDPGPAAELVELPAGNRLGAFTIGSGGLGSPNGVPGGEPGGGSGGTGPGGDSSSGPGSGGSGGGGGAGGTGSIAVNGSGGEASGNGALSPFSAVSLVYPVPVASRPRQSRMLVTSGAGGGGGLSVYGILRGKKIYTIYLPMPGKNWILQYCESRDSSHQNERETPRTVAVRLEPGLVPPSVEEQFDFHRPALPRDKLAEMIVLHGVIREDGSVADVSVLKGLENLADQAALAAFGRWKFKPALHAGNAVAIEVLVGIPAI